MKIRIIPNREKKVYLEIRAFQQGQVDEKTDSARGFYWAGSYAAEGYVAFGADDGSAEGDYSPTATFYTVNPETGAVIDKLTGLNGDVRTTTVYSGGYLYFATKGGSLYKVSVTPEGKLGEPSSIDLKGNDDGSSGDLQRPNLYRDLWRRRTVRQRRRPYVRGDKR